MSLAAFGAPQPAALEVRNAQPPTLTPAQESVLAVIDANGASMLSSRTWNMKNTVHAGSARALAALGVLELDFGPDGTYARRAPHLFGVEYDEDRNTYVVTLGHLADQVAEYGAYLAYRALYEEPARALVPAVQRALRKFKRDGVAVLRAIKKERKRSGADEQRNKTERVWRALPTFVNATPE